MPRNILHVDCNCFYAAVEMQRHPELRDKPLAVCGSQEERHGIVLTRNYVAKPYGIKTGEAIWQARQKCPNLVVLPPDYREYIRFSRMAREIFEDYTDRIEPFGLDESWLDVTGSTGLFGSPLTIAEEISERFKFELGITVSIGVANKQIVYPLPVILVLPTTRSPRSLAATTKSRTRLLASRRTTTSRSCIRCRWRIYSTLALPPAGSCVQSASVPLAGSRNARRIFLCGGLVRWARFSVCLPMGVTTRPYAGATTFRISNPWATAPPCTER